MYEVIHKGFWLKWSALDATDKKLAGWSVAAALGPGIVVGTWAGQTGFRLGYRLGSGGRLPPMGSAYDRFLQSGLFDALTVAAAVCAVISGLLWWRFSRRQDELFNRIQNHALGQAGAWTLAAAHLWWLLSIADLVAEPPVGWFVLLGTALVCLFWFSAVRRWA